MHPLLAVIPFVYSHLVSIIPLHIYMYPLLAVIPFVYSHLVSIYLPLHIYMYPLAVIPFVYSHLVSTGSFLYLLGLAVLKAAAFRPEETVFNGIIMPLSSFLIALVTMIGLIEIGSAIANPWGTDPEDFAVPLMLQVCGRSVHVSPRSHPHTH